MLKVLVVNDSRVMLKMINGYLNDTYEVINCRGSDTLDFTNIKCLVVDTSRSAHPWQVIARQGLKAGVPFIAITMGQDKETQVEVRALGGYGFISMPFTKDQLIEQVNGCIFHNGGAKQLADIVGKNIQSL